MNPSEPSTIFWAALNGRTPRIGRALALAALALIAGCRRDGREVARGMTISLYPAVEGAQGNPKCRDFFGRCMLFETDRPVLQLSDFKFRAVPRTSLAVHDQIQIALDDRQSAKLAEISGKYGGEGKRLAIVFNGKILHAPKLRGRIETREATVDFCNPRLYAILSSVLRGATPPDYDFNADKACSVCVEAPEPGPRK